MPLTPISGLSSYCSAAQFLMRYDYRTIGDYLSDSKDRLTKGDILTNTILAALLGEASGELELRVLRGGRYTLGDLQSLQGNSLELVVGMVAGWAMFLVWSRRPGRFADHQLPLNAGLSVQKMEQLATGELILPFQEAADTGHTNHVQMTPQDVIDRNGLTWQARRMFGRRTDLVGPNQGNFNPFGVS